MLNTTRLTMRYLTVADAPFMLALLNDPQFIHNIGDRGVRTLEQAAQYIDAGPQVSYQQHGFGLLAIQLKNTDTLIGICGLVQRDNLDAPDLGYALLPQYTGCGYATEAAVAALQWAQSLNMPLLYAVVSLHNTASQHLLSKLGFAKQGTMPWHGTEVLLFQLNVLPRLIPSA